jgi:hypothetical protein
MTHRIASAVLLAALAAPALGADDKGRADPAATKLLADARAARAGWDKFPGLRAKLEVNIDGKVSRGTVEIDSKGKVTVSVEDATAAAWAKGQLASLAGHRLDNSAALDSPCAFLDDNKDHPLGRAIRVLDDEFHSSYRVRDRQITVVNRQMKDSRFTITVTENRLNAEKKYLPVSYVVNSWDLKTQALTSSATYHHTWERVGGFDLPATLTVVTATPGAAKEGAADLRLPEGGQVARSLKLSGHELLK